ncbi:MAG: hypothetical protein QGH25_23005, partial [Candidatus Latescibacteria bacterium]|nr:hypothetical protein [Candidatus Latescibacterota bacterium]
MNFNIKGLGAPKNLGARIAPAGHPSASTDAHAAKTGRKRLSEPVLRAAIRIGDKAIVGASGLVMYLGSAMLHDQALSSRYFSAIAVTIFVAAAVFQWAGVYSGDYLFSRRRRIETLLFAWLGTTVLMISAAFSLGVPDYYSRAWAGNSNNSVTPDPVECGANLDRPARGLGNRADRPLDHAECPGTGNLGGCIVCQPLPVFGHRPPDRLGLKHAPNLRRL